MARLSRRKFLMLSGVAAATAAGALPLFHFRSKSIPSGAQAVARPKLNNWEDLYRERWTWDSVAKGAHGWLNCRSACSFDLYIKDGIIVREEQAGTYEASEPGLPDFNPRGCQKGACYTEVMYGPSRLTVPLKRVGPRGSGKWERIGWEQALSEIAASFVAIAKTHGADTIFHDLGPHFDQGATTAARTRFFSLLGGSMADDWGEIGDLNLGNMLTFGFPHMGGTSDEWFLSDFLVVWMMNPAVTQIPDAHFLNEARYNGTTVTVIDPVYSATAIHADRWIPIAPGADAALALAVARHVWDSGRIDVQYVREQTDLPFLVRLDTGRFLRESDLVKDGRDNQLYMWDPKAEAPEAAPGCEGATYPRIFLDGREPPLEGRFDVTLAGGDAVQVVTVGTLVREQLALWTFERAAAVTGLHAELIEKFAEDFAAAERPMILSSWGSNRYFHSDLMNRAKNLCLALKGAIGKRGSGMNSTGWVGLDGFELFADKRSAGLIGGIGALGRSLGPRRAFDMATDLVTRKKTMSEVMYKMIKDVSSEMCLTNSASLNIAYQGVGDVLDEEQKDLAPRTLTDYAGEAVAKNWMPLHPAKSPPKAWITGGNNVLRRTNLPQKMLETLWPQLDIVIDVNFKLTYTGMHADYLLPAAGYYEKPGIKYPIAYVPYLHYGSRAVEPLGESKDEWEIYSLLATEIQKQATQRNLPEMKACGTHRVVDWRKLGDTFSMNGHFGPMDAESVCQDIIDGSDAARGLKIDVLKHTGIGKYKGTGGVLFQSQLYNDDWKGEGVLTAATHQVKEKWHWPTLTGRQQFYVDHPWFLETGESLPTHKESPKAGGDFPFQMVSCHSRWSVHSIWRDTPMLMRLQRGEPLLYLNPADAARAGIADHDWAEVYNRLGSFRMRVKHSTMVRPSMAYYFHAWEPYQFPDHKSYKWITPGLMKPLHFAGGEGQVGWLFAMYEPGTHVQDTRVGIRRAPDQSST